MADSPPCRRNDGAGLTSSNKLKTNRGGTHRRKNAVDESLAARVPRQRESAAFKGRQQTGHKSDPCSVCVQDIIAGTTATQIEVALRRFGSIEHVDLRPADRKDSSALAFVTFKTEADAARCLRRTQSSRRLRHTVSVNGQLLKIERPKSSTRLSRTHRRKNPVDESLSTAQDFLAGMEADVTADVEASIATAGGCMKRDEVDAIVKGRLAITATAWLRAKTSRFTLQEEDSGADVQTGLQQIAAPWVAAEELKSAIGGPIFNRLVSAARSASSDGSVKSWLQARPKLFAVTEDVDDRPKRWSVGLRERVGPDNEPEPEPEPEPESVPLLLPPPPPPPPQAQASLEQTDEQQRWADGRVKRRALPKDVGMKDQSVVACVAMTGSMPAPSSPPQSPPASSHAPMQELHSYLQEMGYLRYENNFIQHQIAFDTLLLCEESDLAQIGIAKGPRVKMMRTARSWRKTSEEPSYSASRQATQPSFIDIHPQASNFESVAIVLTPQGAFTRPDQLKVLSPPPPECKESSGGSAQESPEQANTEHRYIKVTEAETGFADSQRQADTLEWYDNTDYDQALPAEPVVAAAASDFSWQQQQWVSATPQQPQLRVQQTKSATSNSALLIRLRKEAYVSVVRDSEVRMILFGLVKLITDKKRTGPKNRTAAGMPMQAAAKFFSAYVFKEFTHGGSTAGVASESDSWSRVGGCTDPLIPASAVAWPTMRDDFSVLVQKFWLPSKASAKDVGETFIDMLAQWKAAAKRVAEAATHAKARHAVVQQSNVEGDPNMSCLSCCGKTLFIHTLVLTMLRERYNRYAPQLDGEVCVDPSDDGVFLTVVFNMQMRYESLANFDQGNQGALPQEAFQVLREDFGVYHECFASPLNVCPGAQEQTFNTLFRDTDKYFGSKSSFFEFWPETGSYEVNPPFDKNSVEHTFQHIVAIMEKSESQDDQWVGDKLPLLFIVITPFVTSAADEFLLRKTELKANKHYFTKGFAHRKLSKHIQDRPTSISFIGNDAAAATWSICDKTVKKLEDAFSLRQLRGT